MTNFVERSVTGKIGRSLRNRDDTIQPSGEGMATTAVRAGRVADHRYYYACAILFALVVFAGFSRTYYLKSWFENEPLSLLLHVHGVIMTLWYALFVVQVILVARRRLALHQKLGWAGVVLAGAVVIVGTLVAAGLARRALLHNPNARGAPFLFGMLLFSVLMVFVILIALAVYRRRRPDYHKRLMTLAMLTVLGPAVTRLPLSFLPNHDVGLTIAINVGLVLLAIASDTFIHRRLHPAFGWGGVLVIGSMFVFFPICQSDAWRRVVKAIVL